MRAISSQSASIFSSMVFALLFLPHSACIKKTSGSLKTLYGDDDRRDIFDSNSNLIKEAARSVALIADQGELTSIDATSIGLGAKTLKDRYKVCDEEHFSAQISAGFCTAFLIDTDIVATAGHCLDQANVCESMRIVFDFAQPRQAGQAISIPNESVYRCREVLAKTYQNSPGFDFALLRLDRAVKDRRPLSYRKAGELALGESLVLVGHPLGLPLKAAANAHATADDHPVRFEADLDGYEINSGSPVLNADSGEVEGIFVGGWTDLVRNSTGCKRSYSCKEDCTGAQVVRIGVIKSNLPGGYPDFDGVGTKSDTYGKDHLALAIPNNDPLGVTQLMEVNEKGIVADVAVRLKISHPSADELNLTLTPPGGTPLPLTLPRALRGRDVDLTFGAGHTPVVGLSKLRGIPAQGTWKVSVVDSVGGGDKAAAGTLEELKLILATR